MSALRVYVAGASAEVELVSSYIERLRAGGVIITHDWTASVLANRGTPDADLSSAARRGFASDDMNGVRAADLMWMLVPNGSTIGAWFELGYAAALEKELVVSGYGCSKSIFTELATQLLSHDSALAYVLATSLEASR